MAAPTLAPAPFEAPDTRDLAAEAAVLHIRDAAAVARRRLAEIEGVRVIGAETTGDASAGVRLAIDLRDTGRNAWSVACTMAARGFPLETASARVILLRLRDEDVAAGMHERLAPALLLALWGTPGDDEPEPELPLVV